MVRRKVSITNKVEVKINGNLVRIKGKLGELERKFDFCGEDIKVEKVNDKMVVSCKSEKRKAKSLVGTIAAHLRNMIKGVTQGYEYELKVVYMHFPITLKVEKDKIIIQNFLGERTPRIANIVGSTKVEVKGREIKVKGIDLEAVSQTAANLEQATRIVGKDRRTFQDGIFITKKGK